MKKLKESLAAKIASLVLAVVFSAACVIATAGVVYCAETRLYYTAFESSFFVQDEAEILTYSLAHNYMDGTLGQSVIDELLHEEKLLVEFYVNGNKYCENYSFSEDEPLWNSYGYSWEYEDGHTDEFELKYIANPESSAWRDDPGFFAYTVFKPLGQTGGILLCVLFGILWIVMLIFYISAAGHKKDHEGIYVCGFNRIPTDILIGLYAIAFIGAVYLLDWSGLPDNYEYSGVISQVLVISLICGAAEAVVLTLFSSIAVRIKARTFWKNTLIYRILKLLWRVICAAGRALRSAYRALPMLWKTILMMLGFAAIGFVLFLIAAWGAWEASLIFAILVFLLFAAAGCMISLQLQKLRAAGERLAAGDLEYKTDAKKMFWDFKKHAENLNSISDVLGAAVEERTKSERMKTELITNVSHDIKTPLTSIINYVDLLKKPHTAEEEKAYLDVLDRQSQRMKKLMEDLVEASKASTGNISVNPAPTNVGEFLRQAVSEYEERFAKAELIPVVHIPAEELIICADGKLLWRVMDNLMGNVCKYAQPHTRVYLRAEESEETVILSIKNISREMLDIEAAELTERFVRGDDSRNTEGSGLGLNIAKSLTELQGGKFGISIDGDLFKAEITFAEYSAS